MSLTGSLFAGVSGLNSQGTVMGIIGDNIANISTVGFKSGTTTFASLVTGDVSAGGGGSGVTAANRLAIDQQGLIQSTGISTDIAISGQGFFVAKDNPEPGEGQFLYTRAGSFRQDQRGNFVNSAGFVLQAWPLDNEGRLPGEIGNLNTISSQLLESLISVNTRDISGLAFATTNVALGLNLDAGTTILKGAGDTIKPTSTINTGVASDAILAQNTGTIETGDILDVTLGIGTTFSFNYGGFMEGYNITANNIFGAATTAQRFSTSAPAGPTHLAEGDAFTITTVSAGTVTFTFREFSPNSDLGTFNSLDTLAAAIDAIPALHARVAGNKILISAVDAREAISFADVGTATFIAEESIFQYGEYNTTNDPTVASVFGAATTTAAFVPGANITNGQTFTIQAGANPVRTFTYTDPAAPVATSGEFDSLDTLRLAIESTFSSELNAKFVGGQLVISGADPTDSITIANGTITTFSEFGFAGSSSDSTIAVTSTNRFNTLSGLSTLVNEQSGLSASIESAANDASVTINVDDPLETIQFTDGGGSGNLITEFGLSSTTFSPIYDATGVSGKNMASGDIAPAFSRNIRVFDSLGTGHDVRVSFVKSGNNARLVEVFVANEDEIVTTAPDGQMAAGTILFNGDGTLKNVSTSLSSAIQIVWSNEALPSNVTLDLGTAGSPAGTPGATQIGLTDGLSQFNGPFNVQFVDQNGAGSGLLSSLEIDQSGFVIANFSNGQSRKVFKIPLASFPNVNGLTPKAGNVFSSSDGSGEFSLNQAGASGVGVISVAALEGANVELADELTKMIIAQRAFQANTKIITTADQLLEELNRI